VNVTVESASADEAPIIANLMELYLHDFAELGGPSIGPDGRYGYPYLEEYWREFGRLPFLIRVDGELAGFALVTERRLLEPDAPGHELTEFFVLRGWRRQGVGRAAAVQLFMRLPGHWAVGELVRNVAAIAFWRRVIGDLTGGRYREAECDFGGRRGVMQSFEIGG
jgi:predicted acetyltransferase